jgi:cob(I)alamin adenosyltransferase
MLSKLYTKTGDKGTTIAHPGTKVTKDDLLIEVYGVLDELNCTLGMVLADKNIALDLQKILQRTQQELSDLSKELYNPTQILITESSVTQIEQDIDQLDANLPKIKHFILPGGNLASATCHLARAICRRAERRIISIKANPIILKYINRLSDLLFVIARSL